MENKTQTSSEEFKKKFAKKNRFSSPFWKFLKLSYIISLFAVILGLLILNRTSLAQIGSEPNQAQKYVALTLIGALPHAIFLFFNFVAWMNREVGRDNPSMSHVSKFSILCLVKEIIYFKNLN